MSSEFQKKIREKRFCDALFLSLGLNARFKKYGDPNKREPDCIYSLDGKKVGCEVTEVWYSEEDAKLYHKLIRKERVFNKDNSSIYFDGVLEPDRTMIIKIQEAIEKKHLKNYEKYSGIDYCYLILAEGFLLTSSAGLKEQSKNMNYISNKFDKIFMLIKDFNTYKSIEIDTRKLY